MQGFFFPYRLLMAFLRNRCPHFINTYDMKNLYSAFCPFEKSDNHLENFNGPAYFVELSSVSCLNKNYTSCYNVSMHLWNWCVHSELRLLFWALTKNHHSSHTCKDCFLVTGRMACIDCFQYTTWVFNLPRKI